MIVSDPADPARTTRNPRGAGATKSAASIGPTPRPARVLWVDDDASLNRFAERLLPRSGFQVTVAADAAAAMLIAARREHAAMVLDQRLPDHADLFVLRKLRAAGSTMPVVVLTGYGSPASAVEALTLGIVDYQVKPVSGVRILAAIRSALRAGPARPPANPPALALHPDVSLASLSVLFNLEHADEHQLRTQLAWAAADEGLSFVECVGAVEALRHLLADPPEPDDMVRRHVGAWLRRATAMSPSTLHPAVQEFVRLITVDGPRTWRLKPDALANDAGASLPELSRLVRRDLAIGPERCRLIGHLKPALKELARSNEQVAQIAYQLGYNLPSAFDNVFHRLWQVTPSGYRALLTGLAGHDQAQ